MENIWYLVGVVMGGLSSKFTGAGTKFGAPPSIFPSNK